MIKATSSPWPLFTTCSPNLHGFSFTKLKQIFSINSSRFIGQLTILSNSMLFLKPYNFLQLLLLRDPSFGMNYPFSHHTISTWSMDLTSMSVKVGFSAFNVSSVLLGSLPEMVSRAYSWRSAPEESLESPLSAHFSPLFTPYENGRRDIAFALSLPLPLPHANTLEPRILCATGRRTGKQALTIPSVGSRTLQLANPAELYQKSAKFRLRT